MWPEISMIGLAAFMAFMFGRLSKKLDRNREDGKKQTEEIKMDIKTGRACDLNFLDKLGDLTHEMATAARDKKCFNGRLNAAIENFEDAKKDRDDYMNNKIAAKSG